MKNKSYVNASEVGEFVYCKRAWWLRFMGLSAETDQMVLGTKEHESLRRNQGRFQMVYGLLFIIALISLLIIILILFFMRVT